MCKAAGFVDLFGAISELSLHENARNPVSRTTGDRVNYFCLLIVTNKVLTRQSPIHLRFDRTSLRQKLMKSLRPHLLIVPSKLHVTNVVPTWGCGGLELEIIRPYLIDQRIIDRHEFPCKTIAIWLALVSGLTSLRI
jgi:hypothetical protein